MYMARINFFFHDSHSKFKIENLKWKDVAIYTNPKGLIQSVFHKGFFTNKWLKSWSYLLTLPKVDPIDYILWLFHNLRISFLTFKCFHCINLTTDWTGPLDSSVIVLDFVRLVPFWPPPLWLLHVSWIKESPAHVKQLRICVHVRISCWFFLSWQFHETAMKTMLLL